MTSARGAHNNSLQYIVGLLALLISLLAIFPGQYMVMNIAIVSLLFFFYILSNNGKIKMNDIFVAFLALAFIVIQLDVSKISIFVAFLFWQTKMFYKESSVKMYCNVLLICFICALIAYIFFGFNQQYDKIGWSASQQTNIVEKGMGFTNANRCMLFAFVLSCIMILQTEKLWHYLLILLLNYVLFQHTQSRTFFYILLLIVVVLLGFKLFRAENKISFVGKLVPLAYLLIFVLSFVLPYFFSDTFLNAIFTGRLAHNKAFLETGITLLGNQALETATFDSSYLHMLLTKGVLFFAAFSILLIVRCRKAVFSNKSAVILCAVFLTGFMEVIFLESNILYLMGIIFNSEVKEGEIYAQ